MSQTSITEREDIAQTISQFPCGRCDADGSGQHCKEFGQDCWNLYRKEAEAVQRKFTMPLRALNYRLRIIAGALVISCLCLLMYPPQTTRHHILETFVHTIVEQSKYCMTAIPLAIHNAILPERSASRGN